MVLFEILSAGAGLVGGILLKDFQTKRNVVLKYIIRAIKKRDVWIGFLETDKLTYFTSIVKFHRNLGITHDGDIIIFPEASGKPCPQMNGAMIFHADLYKSIATTRDLRLFFWDLKQKGWSDDEIANFIHMLEIKDKNQILEEFKQEVEKHKKLVELQEKITKILNDKKLKDKEKKEKIKPLIEEFNKTKEGLKEPNFEKLQQKIKVFMALPSTVKNFVYTGLDRVLIHNIIRELVYQRELEKLKQKNWVQLAIAILLIMIGGFFILKALPQLLAFFMGK